ncbi:MAG: ABC transporter permease [Coprothermobacterota bacterium]|nr:ABC transporter permease [Coprothermobacterota bacterium]
MNKTYLIFRHEFLQTIRRTGFIILTLTLPVLALLGIGVFYIVSGATKPPADAIRIGYVDEAGGFDKFMIQGNLTLVRFDVREAATSALMTKEIAEYFVIPADFISTGVVSRYTMQRELSTPAAITDAIKNFFSSNLLAGKVPATSIVRIEAPLNLVTTMLTSTGAVAPEQGGFGNFIIPGIFSLLLMFALLFSSIYVIQSLSEEKENRLMEILLSSVSTRQLLTGKLLGLGVAGLAQVAVWVISLPLLLKLASSSIGGIFSTIQLPASFLVLGVVYFVLGYSVFAVLSACVAAISSTAQEAQGFVSIYTLFAMAPLWCFSLLLLFPNSLVWIVFSIFPFSAPVLVMLRLGLTGVPAWQLIISIAVMMLCIVGGLVLAAKLLRTYVLMYGKRPSVGEMIRNFRN